MYTYVDDLPYSLKSLKLAVKDLRARWFKLLKELIDKWLHSFWHLWLIFVRINNIPPTFTWKIFSFPNNLPFKVYLPNIALKKSSDSENLISPMSSIQTLYFSACML